jgi:hypothetical protein
LAVSINENRVTAALIDAVYPRDVSCRLCSIRADADGVGLSSETGVSDVDVVIAGGEIYSTVSTYCDVGAATNVIERLTTNSRIKVAVNAPLQR